ncbi:hypothetical protein V5799_000098 [Amblyomma americanum]|uniref:Tetraspanin n=1 Tax=Amblyomma americanum TaxID=6943 RepID=A0AAQ4D411_AMBAM
MASKASQGAAQHETPHNLNLSGDQQVEGDKSLSTTTQVHARPRARGVIVGVNLTVVLLALVALWCATYSFAVRPSNRNSLLYNLLNKSFLFTLFMHLDALIIALSVASGTVAAFGLVAALRENIIVLEVYQSLIAVLIVANSVLAIAGALGPQSARDHIKESAYVEFIQGYRRSEYFQHLIDALQSSMDCCGFSTENFRDWDRNEYFRCVQGNPSRERCSVPHSCCRSRVLSVNDSELVQAPRFCGRGVLLMEDQEAWRRVYTRSCADAALTYVMDNLVVFVGVGMVLNMLMLGMLATSILLQDQIRTITAIYDAYYKAVNEGQEAMEEAGVIKLPQRPLEQPPEKPAV